MSKLNVAEVRYIMSRVWLRITSKKSRLITADALSRFVGKKVHIRKGRLLEDNGEGNIKMALESEIYMEVLKIVDKSRSERFGKYNILSAGGIRYRNVKIKIEEFRDVPDAKGWGESIYSSEYTNIYEGKTDKGKMIFTGIDDYQNCYQIEEL